MARFELKRYVYMCDGRVNASVRCKGSEVIDAATGTDADSLVRKRGWEMGRNGTWTCRGSHYMEMKRRAS